MTYLVLARKWRPRSFDTLVGQDHVVRALTHALDTQRLHHAWLFTGTRGVGKTTLSRILAKSLNCETGITSKPCGVCRACTEIDSGRFVDYLELDAASNRGVEEMTQLLEQAVYAPGAGRFKVYMIDEVHMLTGHAFNAMLKTLEEPPPHVKFILATTDPQKIPVTVLSRCLQFNLKQMPADSIVGHLQAVLGQEQVGFEIPALRLIGQAASGSMRDALSLTDQAIAYSAGNLTEEAVRGMLGTIDQRHLVRLLDALATGDAKGVLAVADELAIRGLSYAGALADLAVLLSRVAIEQRVTGVTPAEDPLAADISRLAQALHPDAVQLFYSVAVHSRGELTLAPDEYAGFIMACLRMLALNGEAGPQTALEAPAAPARQTAEPAVAAAAPVSTPAPVAAPRPQAAQVEAPAAPAPAPVAAPESVAPAQPTQAAAPQAAASQAVAPQSGMPAAPATEEPASVASVAQAAPAEPSAAPEGVPPWEELPDAAPAAVQAKPGAAALAVTPVVSAVTAPAPAQDEPDGPPSWVDEEIPYEAEGGFVPESGFTSDPDDEFETLASAPSSAAPAAAAPVRREAPPARKRQSRARIADMTQASWPELAARLPVTGLAAELARQSEWAGVHGDAIVLRVAVKTLAESESRVRLQTVLCEHFGQGIRLDVDVGAVGDATAHAVAQAERAARQQAAEDAVAVDPFVQALVSDFGGQVVAGSVRHVDAPAAR
ncbi:DNA polymerase III subunit gamma/tau [Achromobacter sp. Marseille-Q0513]|uniref:DNA polymerase III subunit gamma/tau n=1 Tax=Achromobacter sp. Marseille-Q0513 TaxID=2829161 RepID=UPI001B92D6B2|nr:DNA polymerase III subunit gamma/tau [Achromobacter sp. Marseille-Q0513]MBR8653198.1 DNA polymerase III subunit gamma/tau [Achromobacter sp. Marseille-Q0513]